MRKIVVGILIFILSFSLSFSTEVVAGPPGHARGGGPPSHAGGNSGNSSPQPSIFDGNNDVRPGDRVIPGQNRGTPPGLLDKGGLPPGLHGRSVDELPPGIRNNQNFQEAVKRLKEEEQQEAIDEPTLIVNGKEAIILPDEGEITSQYTAKIDSSNEPAKVNANWSLGSEKEGVSINEDGLLKVTEGAEQGSITVEASYKKEEDVLKGRIKVELYSPEIADVEIEGDEFVALDGELELPINLEYKAVVKDQFDKVMENENVNWIVESEDIENITVDENGIVTINENIEEKCVFKIIASAEEDIKSRMEISVYIPEIAEIEILGETHKKLNESSESPITLEYTAVVKDQLGKEIEDEKAVLKLVTDNNDVVSLDEKGVVTIKELPEFDESLIFGITAVSETNDEIDNGIIITVYYPIPNRVEVEGENQLVLPDEDKIIESRYVGAVQDQHDQEIEGKEIYWALADEEIIGISIDNHGILTVTGEAEEGTVKIYGVYIIGSGEDEDYIVGDYDIELIKPEDLDNEDNEKNEEMED